MKIIRIISTVLVGLIVGTIGFAGVAISAQPQVAGGLSHSVGLQSDGMVVATGDNTDGQCEVSDWTNIVQVAAGGYHTVGLQSDGMVVATGDNSADQCDVSGWTDIVQVAAGDDHTVGLRTDGTVVVAGDSSAAIDEVGVWEDITQVAAGDAFTIGMRSGGAVVVAGTNSTGLDAAAGWTGMIQVAAGTNHALGITSDHVVVVDSDCWYGECPGSWTEITQVAGGTYHTVGLLSNGTVLGAAYSTNSNGVANIGDWENIIQIAAGANHSLGLMADGKVVATGRNSELQCEVTQWDLGVATEPQIEPEDDVILDTDGDGVPDDVDLCPEEDSNGFDADEDGCVDSLDGLKAMIKQYIAEGSISRRTGYRMLWKVKFALWAERKGKIRYTVYGLKSLKRYVQYKAKKGNRIDIEAADMLEQYTNNLIWQLSDKIPSKKYAKKSKACKSKSYRKYR